MDFSYSPSGTPQQVRWVQDAIAECSFPLDKALGVTVTVQWGGFPSNADTRHPYMVTQIESIGNFLITIAPWADDPNNPANQGLPDPQGDIYEFYKQSFVHELGHVITDCTFNPAGADTDPRVGQACVLFWQGEVDSGPGRRIGTIGDWDDPALAWGNEIREAVAEAFKVAFFTGRLIFGNRSNWQIDEKQWPTLLSLWSLGVPQPNNPVNTAQDHPFTNPDPNFTDLGGRGYTVVNGNLVSAGGSGHLVGRLSPALPPLSPVFPGMVLPAVAAVVFDWPLPTGWEINWFYTPSGTPESTVSLTVQGPLGTATISADEHMPLAERNVAGTSGEPWSLVICVNPDGSWFGGLAAFAPVLGQPEPPDGTFPGILEPDNLPTIIWDTYHHLGAGNIGFIESVSAEIENAGGPVTLLDFYLKGPGASLVTPASEYPFASQYGEIAAGAASTGLFLAGPTP